ncbi:hypothetical protein SAMN04489716_5600 [Actinoplanes derwentensis]|uniref:Uncharacterized protein n=1 Tax=Actinoplanes derwentensis TaxID=113562 RepID=A0A1H2CDF5_9ACTN|nr:hypothetical protein Ade03nite_62650 [Actinoplanes derwentensis]SDT68282.1 hypothetical protein SAMN04489716_5600 [Actinoplanes derwentensis]
MSVISTFLVFLIIPAAIIGTVATFVFAGSDRSKPSRRYRPGRPFDFPAMWFTATPQQVTPAGGGHSGLIIEDSSGSPVRPGSTGGASDSW